MNNPIMNKFIVFILLLIGLIIVVRFSFLLIGILMPFVLGFIIATLANPLKKRIEKLNIPSRPSAFLSIVLIIAVIVLFFYLLFTLAKSGFHSIEQNLSLVIDSFSNTSRNIYSTLQKQYPRLITSDFSVFVSNLQDGGLLSLKEFNFSGKVFSFARGLPSSLIFIIFTFMSSYYFSAGYDKIMGFLRKKILYFDSSKEIINSFRISIKLGLGSWFKAQLVIMSFSFLISSIFFYFLKIPYPVLVGMGLALFDGLPLFGAGAVLWPISIYYLITGNFINSFIAFLLYIVIITIRQIVEPKLIGQEIGIHPLVTLLTIYLGLKLFGVAGIIIGIIILVIATSILRGKAFKDFYKSREEEYEQN